MSLRRRFHSPALRAAVRSAGKILLLATLAGLVGAAAMFAYFSRGLPNPEKFNERRVAESTKIFDRTGKILLYEIHGEEKRTIVSPEEIPDIVKKATIAVEDANFYGHYGVEPKAILRALYYNLRKKSRQGGSTITQQLIRNTLIGRERTIARKLRELILALELERRYAKDEILTFYLNQIPYGANTYGVEAASETYFGKRAKDLSLAEAAVLAAIPRAPSYYSPFSGHLEDLKKRQEFILERMRHLNFINEETFATAKKQKLAFAKESRGIRAPHFVLHVREKLAEQYGERYLEEGGLIVQTSLDWDLQQRAEALIKKYALENEKKFKAENAALVAIDPRTGELLAMVGSRDYFDEKIDGNVNVALRPRQPGSAFKPFAYAAAFGKGYTPSTMLFDLETNFAVPGAEPYIPKNYDGKFRGPVPMRAALAQSLNVPSVKTLYLAGLEDTIRTAEGLGITTFKERSRFGLSLVLGGGEVTLLELAGAYAAFAADGLLHARREILSIRDVQGQLLKEYRDQEKQVLNEEVARQINDVLSDNAARAPIFGERSSLFLGDDPPAAAKTGTTQDARDAWVIGYTPAIVAGVWVGNNDNRPMNEKGAGISAAGPIWNAFMRTALGNAPRRAFTKPLPVKTGKALLDGEFAHTVRVKTDRVSGKRATELTPPTAIVERSYQEVHTILAFLNRENPRGPDPENPVADPQFWNWEAPIEHWVATENEKGAHYNERIPELYDDVHTGDAGPALTITAPSENELISSRQVIINAAATGKFPPRQVEFFLDGKFLGVDQTPPFSFTLALPPILEGVEHTITARLYDFAEQQAEANRRFRLAPHLLPARESGALETGMVSSTPGR